MVIELTPKPKALIFVYLWLLFKFVLDSYLSIGFLRIRIPHAYIYGRASKWYDEIMMKYVINFIENIICENLYLNIIKNI